MGKKLMQGKMSEKNHARKKPKKKKIQAQDGPHFDINQNLILLEKCSKMHQMVLEHVLIFKIFPGGH